MNRSLAAAFSPAGDEGARGEEAVRRALAGEGEPEIVARGPLTLGSTGGAVARVGGVHCVLAGSVAEIHALTLDAGAAAEAGPEHILAAAYGRWGDGLLARLRGRFALALWDIHALRGLIAVDQLGAGSLFSGQQGGTLFVASEIGQLLRMLARTPEPDRGSVARWISGRGLEPSRTLYEGVRRLAGGHAIVIDREGWSQRRYWTPVYHPPLRLDAAASADEVRAAVLAAVAERVAPGRTGVLLSGGLDSASVAAASRAILGRQGQLRAYSLLFPRHPAMDEGPLIAALTAELGLAGKRALVYGGSMLAGGLEYLRAWGVPSVSPNLAVQLPLLRAAADDGISVLLDGQGGDELFGSEPFLLADYVRRGRLGAAASRAREIAAGSWSSPRRAAALVREYALKGALPPVAHRLARRVRGDDHYAPTWLSPLGARLAGRDDEWDWKRLPGPRWWAHLADQLTTARERMEAHDYLRRKLALAGVGGGHPFLDDLGLVELVLRLPPEHAFDARFDRPLLRAAVDGLVPDVVRLRAEKSFFNALFVETLAGVDRAAVEALLGSRESELGAYVRPAVVREQLLDARAEQRGGAWAWTLWRLAGAECWLRSLADPGFAERAPAEWNLAAPKYAVAGRER